MFVFHLALLLIFTLLTYLPSGIAEEVDYLQEEQTARDARMQWWRDAKFGLFIHWGPYAVPAGTHNGQQVKATAEWIQNVAQIPLKEYEAYARQFNPVKFDSKEWAQLAKDAGMKYVVITSKHHDGFCLWDSKVTEYDIVDFTPFRRDVLEELTEAVKASGLKMCFYHSIMDWHHPDAQALFEPDYNSGGGSKNNPHFARYVGEYMKPQLHELIERFDPAVMWFDGEWIKDWTEPQGKALYNELRASKPSLIINNRVGKGRQGMQGFNKDETYAGDFGTPEQEIPDQGLPGIDWESCMTMNDTWGYNQDDHNWKSTETLIHQLIDIVSKGGNFLLNVGPTAEGTIPEASVERLRAMGRWLQTNGEAIYAAEASPFDKPAWGRFTTKPGVIYAHIFDWPAEGKLAITSNKLLVKKAYLLVEPENLLPVEQAFNLVTIQLPKAAPDPIASVVVIEVASDL